jgi:hypothetical protein
MADAIRRYNTNAANVSRRYEAVVCIEKLIHVDAVKEEGKLAPGSVGPAGSGSVTIYTQVA